MYDPTFSSAELARLLNKNDFLNRPALKNGVNKENLIVQAVNIARNGFTTLPLTPNNLAGRTIYQVNDLASDLVLRKAAYNIRKITASKQGSRFQIVNRLRLLCEEGLSFTIARMDIKRFYPSVDHDFLLGEINRRFLTAPSTRFVVRSLIEQCKVKSVNGLPPGLAISAELSEFYMQEFDQRVKEQINPHYFARYVDDIVLILPELDDPNSIMEKIKMLLPPGLRLNSLKTKLYQFKNVKTKRPTVEHNFDYLGFNFSVFQIHEKKPFSREVRIDIATSKIRKNKTRIVKSILQYLSDRKFNDLRDRIRILTSSYQFFDERRQKKRSAGLQYTYSLINSSAPALDELDKFFTSMVLCRSGPIGQRLMRALNNQQRKELLTYSFVRGFANRVHFRFKADRLAKLMECWKYV